MNTYATGVNHTPKRGNVPLISNRKAGVMPGGQPIRPQTSGRSAR